MAAPTSPKVACALRIGREVPATQACVCSQTPKPATKYPASFQNNSVLSIDEKKKESPKSLFDFCPLKCRIYRALRIPPPAHQPHQPKPRSPGEVRRGPLQAHRRATTKNESFRERKTKQKMNEFVNTTPFAKL